jgi:hypothetical protein
MSTFNLRPPWFVVIELDLQLPELDLQHGCGDGVEKPTKDAGIYPNHAVPARLGGLSFDRRCPWLGPGSPWDPMV